jgi:hypothetical protein
MGVRKEIKNKEEILQLLKAVWELSQVAIIHCRGHQRGTDFAVDGTAWLSRQQGGQQKN